MSRHGYSEDLDQASLAMWRGRVASSIRGKRGQAFLKELEASLLALPEKRLISSAMAYEPEKLEGAEICGDVCALGSVALRRKIVAGKAAATALKEISVEWPEPDEPEHSEMASKEFDIAQCLAQEIMWLNDEVGGGTPETRYERMLTWVRENIKATS